MYGKKASAAVKEEINSLKNNLNQINTEKEAKFRLKEELKGKIREMIDKVRGVKQEKDKFSAEIQKLRAERDSHNAKVRELILKIKGLHYEKKKLCKQYGIKFDVVKIKEKIEYLEMKIQTDVISFKKEQKLMEIIKELKKSLEGTSVVNSTANQINAVSKEIDAEREKANEAHKKLKHLLKQDKRDFKEFISLSKEIQHYRKKQEDAFNEFIEGKKKFDSINSQLREKLSAAGRLKAVEDERARRFNIARNEKEQKIIEEKVKTVEEKIKTKQKLTTADLIAFQGKDGKLE